MDPSLYREDSQTTIISLTELDPSPIDTPPSSDTDLQLLDMSQDDLASSVGSARTIHSSTTLGPGSGHGSVFYLSRIQRFSSYAMSIFTSLHLANVSLIPAVTRSVPASESYLLMTREIYQTTFSEPLLVAIPVIAHVGSGIALRLVRWQQNRRRYGRSTSSMYALHKSRDDPRHVRIWPTFSYISASGYAFTVFYSAHAFMNRILPLVADGDSSNIGLAYVAHGFARHPVLARIAYLGLITIGSGHMVWGMAKWLGYAPSMRDWTQSEKLAENKKLRSQRQRHWLSIQGVALAAVAAWCVGGMAVVSRGGLQDGWVGAVYDELFALVGF